MSERPRDDAGGLTAELDMFTCELSAILALLASRQSATPSALGREAGLLELAELSDKATAGEWVRSKHCFQILTADGQTSITELDCPRHYRAFQEYRDKHKANVEFMVACVNYVRAALTRHAEQPLPQADSSSWTLRSSNEHENKFLRERPAEPETPVDTLRALIGHAHVGHSDCPTCKRLARAALTCHGKPPQTFSECLITEAQAVYCLACHKILDDNGKQSLHSLKVQHNRENHISDQCMYVKLRPAEPETPVDALKSLKWALDYIADGLEYPKHFCSYILQPELGICDFCEKYADARAALRGAALRGAAANEPGTEEKKP